MAPETFTLSPCTPDDVNGMADVYLAAFASDPFTKLTFPRASIGDQEMRRWLTERFSALFSKREIRTFKMTDDATGKMAAFLRWSFPHVLTEEEEAERAVEKEAREKERAQGRDPAWPVGANLEICDAKFGSLDDKRAKYVKTDEMYVAHLLATDPAYQRKGLASRLLKHGLNLADSENRKVYIEATKAGHPVYLRLGFKDIDVVSVDLSRWGGKSVGINTIMMRDPQPII